MPKLTILNCETLHITRLMYRKHDNFLEFKKKMGEFLEKIEYFVECYFWERNSPQNKNAAEASYLMKISFNMQLRMGKTMELHFTLYLLIVI